MEPNKDIRLAEEIRNKIIRDYTSKSNRVTSTIEPHKDFKKDIDKVKGFASMDFYVSTSKSEELKKELIALYEEEREVIKAAGLHPLIAEHNYEVREDRYDQFELDPNTKLIRFVLELNRGDYDNLTFPLSDKEEDEMRNAKSPVEINREERIEEKRVGGPRHF